MPDDDLKQAYWRRTRLLMLTAMLMVIGPAGALIVFMPRLNAYRFLRFPLGYFLMADAATVFFAVLVYAFFNRQQHIDRDYNMTIQF